VGAYEILSAFFESKSHDVNRQLASSLTFAINNAIMQYADRVIVPSGFEGIGIELTTSLSVQPTSLNIPWQACYAVNLGQKIGPTLPALESILATVPNSYRMDIQKPSDFSSPYHGSLMGQLAELICQAKHHLCVVNPYWSVQGVNRLQRRVSFFGGGPKEMLVITPHNMDRDNQAGCDCFCQWIKEQGCKVSHLSPLKLPEGYYPLVHAKVIIADHCRAYLGSANLSDNGLVHSIEMGVILQGPAVLYLSEWFDALSPYLQPFHSSKNNF
jgi:hypothetical protein